MKLLLIAVLALATSAFASTRDSETILFDGSNSAATVTLQAEKTHTQYRTESRPQTCYRQMIVGYQTQCTPSTPNRPGQCRQYPIYQNVPYTCYVNVSVPYEVFDYNVEATVDLSLGALPAEMTASEKITVTLVGDTLSLKSVGTKAFVVELASLSQLSNMNGNVKNIQASAVVALHDAAPVKAALSLSNVSVKRNVLTYQMGAVDNVQIKHSLKISKDPIIGSSTVLFNGVLSDSVLSREAQGEDTNFKVAFKDVLGRLLGKGRYSVKIEADFAAGVEVINDQELGGLAVSKSILYKIN